ncbi:unnamed protein product, partial [Ectocarpus sp. 12 AP-2014]
CRAPPAAETSRPDPDIFPPRPCSPATPPCWIRKNTPRSPPPDQSRGKRSAVRDTLASPSVSPHPKSSRGGSRPKRRLYRRGSSQPLVLPGCFIARLTPARPP